jgi:ribosomal protein L7/L12|nr:MAG TPA: ribosomal protein L7/L12 [Caudoviricetes sp.]
MNSIQKYVLNSLFVRNQITEEKLAQALDTFSNEPAIDAFLSVLITGEETKKDVLLTIIGTATRKLQAIKVLKDLFSTGLKETKDLVDMYTDDKSNVTKIPMKKLYTEELDKETMENIERQFKYNGFEIEIK